MYLLLIFLPLFSFLSISFFGRFLGSNGASFIANICLFFSCFFSYWVFYEVGLSNCVCMVKTINWIESEYLNIYWFFYFDSVTAIMLIVVTTISFFVHLYSLDYMGSDPHLSRFLSYLSLFTFFMLILVTANNFAQMFVGWEGVGLASYLLINFWYTRLQANKSAIKAMIVNRIGDFGLILAISLIFFLFKSLDFLVVFSMVPYYSNLTFNFFSFSFKYLDVIGLLLFLGVVGKSAQLGLHVWLPDAMEGPTPVSALIHAATMVTAGVFILIRCSFIIEYSSFILSVIAIAGGITAFFAATTGMLQNDIKRVIAYSTCSQLGYMVFACGLSNYSLALFHLMNHAFFKALLFLSAGLVIHALEGEQDMRKMGGLFKLLPLFYIFFIIGSLALMGFPFFTGFYSKDVILEISAAKYNFYGTFCHWLGNISAFFTAFYSFRLLYLTFLSSPKGPTFFYKKINKQSFVYDPSLYFTKIPLSILCLGSIFVGYMFKDLFIGLGSNFWQNSIYVSYFNYNLIEGEFLPVYVKLIPLFFSFSGLFLSYISYFFFQNFIFLNLIKNDFIYSLSLFLNQKWFFDKIFNFFLIFKLLIFGYRISFKTIDRGFIELFGPLGLVRIVDFCSLKINKSQSGYIYHYALIFILGIIFCFVLLNFGSSVSLFFIDNRILFLFLFLFFI